MPAEATAKASSRASDRALAAGIFLNALASLGGVLFFVRADLPTYGYVLLWSAIMGVSAWAMFIYAGVRDDRADRDVALPKALERASEKAATLRKECNRVIMTAESLHEAVAAESASLQTRLQRQDAVDRGRIRELEARLSTALSDAASEAKTLHEMYARLVDLAQAIERLVDRESGLESDRRLGLLEALVLMRKLYKPLGFDVIDPQPGDSFDPIIHEAVGTQVLESVAEGTIASVRAWGYTVNGEHQPAKVLLAAAE